MNTDKRKKQQIIFVFQLLFIFFSSFTALTSLVYADASTSPQLCTDPQTIEKCYAQNPSYQNLFLIPSPTVEQFQLLAQTDSSQAALYLVSKYNTQFAADYISQIGLSSPDPIQSQIAERFFSESANNVATHANEFQQYMTSKGITIQVLGEISSYTSDGTITADNGQINVKKFGDKYIFVVNENNEILLVPKGSGKQYTFEGTVTQNSNGEMKIIGEGAFDGMIVTNANYIKIGPNGNTLIQAEQYGDLKCQTPCHMVYNPTERSYQLKDAVLADYPDFKVTGTLRLDEKYYGLSTTYVIPNGKKLEVTPIVVNPASQNIADQGYRVLASGGKDVEIALEDDTWLDHPIDFAFQYLGENAVSLGILSEEATVSAKETLKETYQEAVEAGIVPDTKKDKVRLDSEGTVYLESTDAEKEDPASYRMEVDMGAMYTAKQQEEQVDNYIPMADKGFYEKGDITTAGTPEYQAVTQIQTIVGAAPDGKYGRKTEKAVAAWENQYNSQYGLTPDMEGYLDPDGLWAETNTIAYLQSTKQLQEPAALAMDMRGGVAVVELQEEGFDITQTGAMDIEVEGLMFRYDAQGNTDKELQQLVANEISIPVTITSCVSAQSSGTVIGAAIETAVNGANCHRFSSSETTYGLGSLSEGFVNGNVAASCPIYLGMYDPSGAACASHVTALAQVEGGRYQTYGTDNDIFAIYTGQLGSAWQMSHNVRAAGGKSLYWKEENGAMSVGDSRLGAAINYDQNNFQEGDIVGMYFTGSHYLEEASSQGFDGRKNTHVAKIVAKEHEMYKYNGDGTSATAYIQEQLDVTPTYLSGYPVWINLQKAVYSNGEFYYEDTQGNPTGTPINLKTGDRVDVEKTLINHLYHDPNDAAASPTRLDDYGWFLSNYPEFSLYEHYRPSEQKYAEAEERVSGTVAVEVYSDDDINEALAAQGISTSQLELARTYTREINGLPQEGSFQYGDVVMIPSSAEFRERYAGTLLQKMEDQNVANAPEIVTALEVSTKERMKEYGIVSTEYEDLLLTTAEIAYYQKKFVPEEDWDYYIDPSDWREEVAKEFHREQIAAYVEQATDITPEYVSYGYLDTQDATAQENALELYEHGVIETVDYLEPTEMLTYEGSFKHGQREIAKNYERYVTEDMTHPEKLAIVGFAYNRGEDAPALLAVQYQFEELGYKINEKNGMYNSETINIMEDYATKNNIPFDKEIIEQQIKERSFDLDNDPIIVAMKQQYKQKTGKEADYIRFPVEDGYVFSSGNWEDLMDYCDYLNPSQEGCTNPGS